MSEEELDEEPLFFSSSQPPVATTVTVAAPKTTLVEPEQIKPRFEEVLEQPAIITPPPEFNVDPRAEAGIETVSVEARPLTIVEETGAASLFREPDQEPQRDLDVPAFLRRIKF
jgi:hypothetical protein